LDQYGPSNFNRIVKESGLIATSSSVVGLNIIYIPRPIRIDLEINELDLNMVYDRTL